MYFVFDSPLVDRVAVKTWLRNDAFYFKQVSRTVFKVESTASPSKPLVSCQIIAVDEEVHVKITALGKVSLPALPSGKKALPGVGNMQALSAAKVGAAYSQYADSGLYAVIVVAN